MNIRTDQTIIGFNQKPLAGQERKETLEKIRVTKELVTQKIEDKLTLSDGEAPDLSLETGTGPEAKEYHFRTLSNGSKLFAAPVGDGEWGVEHFVMVENTNGTIQVGESGSAGGPLHFAMTTARDQSYGMDYMFS